MSDTTPPTPPTPPVPPPAADANVPPQPNPYAAPEAQPNPYAQPSAYAQPAPYAGAPAYAYAPGPRTNTMAIIGFVLAFVVSVAGIVVSHIALSQIKRTGEGGRGLALAGLILGYVFTGFWVLYVVIIIIVIVVSAGQGYTSYSS
jgi:peptidyl-prolyl cis-trans isomerase B (cyclophilin B)